MEQVLQDARLPNGDFQGLTVEIFRWKLGDCSNKGISSQVDQVFVICPNGNLRASETDLPIVKIVERAGYKSAVQCYDNGKTKNFRGTPMMGGCFIYTTDSRFRRIAEYPVALHDRFEG